MDPSTLYYGFRERTVPYPLYLRRRGGPKTSHLWPPPQRVVTKILVTLGSSVDSIQLSLRVEVNRFFGPSTLIPPHRSLSFRSFSFTWFVIVQLTIVLLQIQLTNIKITTDFKRKYTFGVDTLILRLKQQTSKLFVNPYMTWDNPCDTMCTLPHILEVDVVM